MNCNHLPDRIQERIKELKQDLVALRRDFHQFPELGFKETRTAKKIGTYLQEIGLTPCRIAGTGVTAVLDTKKPGPVLMLRADMDALPITEENDVVYASKNDGVMHACGHDSHMAMLLVAARVLTENRSSLKGKIKFVFQPDEEVAGAVQMVKEGVLENPKVDGVMGIHIWSLIPSGKVCISPGVVMAGLDVFKVRVKGKGGHTGYPHEAVDPVITAANIIQTAQTIQTRELDVQNPTIIMFSIIKAGKKANIIPEEVYMEGTIRFLHSAAPGSKVTPTQKFIRICESICMAHQCTCDIQIEHENIPLVNDQDMVTLAKKAAVPVFGSEHIIESGGYVASEDFSEYSSRVPGVFMFLGCADRKKHTDFPLHNPRFNIDEDVLEKGVELHVKSALTFLNR